MGHGPRGLLGDGRVLDIFPPRPRPQPRLPLGRGRLARHLPTASAGSASPWPCGTARTRSSRSGSSASPARGQPWRRRQGMLFLPRRHADRIPTCKALYKYPQAEFPYARLIAENRRRGRADPEFELLDTGVFDENRYFDVIVEYAKASPERHPDPHHRRQSRPGRRRRSTCCRRCGSATPGLGAAPRRLRPSRASSMAGAGDLSRPITPSLGTFLLLCRAAADGQTRRRCSSPRTKPTPSASSASPTRRPTSKTPFTNTSSTATPDAVNPTPYGTKAAALYVLDVPRRRASVTSGSACLPRTSPGDPFGADVRQIFADRIAEADEFYDRASPPARSTTDDQPSPGRPTPACSGRKQFYHYVVHDWLEGDPQQPPPPAERAATAATATGGTSSTATSSPCPTSGSTPGSPPGTWPST